MMLDILAWAIIIAFFEIFLWLATVVNENGVIKGTVGWAWANIAVLILLALTWAVHRVSS